MSHTIPNTFTGTPLANDYRVGIIKEWYISNLADSDMADDPGDSGFYIGAAWAFESVLLLLHGMPLNEGQDDSEGLPIHILDSDNPATCPQCGVRTVFEERDNGTQAHHCPNCHYSFTGEFEPVPF